MLKVLLWPGFLLLLLAQWLVPARMIWKKNKVLNDGTSYKFKTEPVDPSNPFIGKYIILNFKEDSYKVIDTKKFSYGDKVYVVFYSDNKGFAKIKSIDLKKPGNGDFVEADIRYINLQNDSSGSVISLIYPFNRFYMDEYKAPKAEKVYRERNIDTTLNTYALVKVLNGDAVVKYVYVNDSLITDVIKARN